MKELYVPINHQQGHWLFLRVQMDTKVITLWDSQGRKEENQLYLQSMLRYLGDVYKSKTGQDEATWKREWELIDDSVNSPRQHSGYDCGVFVITNITLLAQKIPLKRKSQRKTLESGLRFSCGLPVKTAFSTKTKATGDGRRCSDQKHSEKREEKHCSNIHHKFSNKGEAEKKAPQQQPKNHTRRVSAEGDRALI